MDIKLFCSDIKFHTAVAFALSLYEAALAACCSLLSWVICEHCLWDCSATQIKGWSQLNLKWASKHGCSASKRVTVAKRNVPGWLFYWLCVDVDEYARTEQQGLPSLLTVCVLQRQPEGPVMDWGKVILVAVQRADVGLVVRNSDLGICM